MAAYYKSLSVLVLSLTCLISFAQSIRTITNGRGVTIGLIHRDSPLSPSHDSSKTRFQRLRDAIDRSFSRKSFLLRKTSRSVDQTSQAPLTRAGGEFLIEYQLGTPPVRQLSIADTGSDLTWIQCKPCTSCYEQDYPLFDPAATNSYKPVGCQTDECTNGGSTGCGDNNVCQYQVSYGDRSFSQGDLAAETLTLGKTASFRNFVFGCGKDNDGTFSSAGSGIFGLGNGAASIVNQQESAIRGRFSYCLTSFESNATSTISFGNDAVVTGSNVQSTPLVSKNPDTFYYLTLQGLSVGEQRFEYKSSSSIKQQSGEEGNIIIDSGTTLTFVPSDLYGRIETSLKSAIEATPVTDPQGTFNLCYSSQNGSEFTAPSITAHFEGADVVLPGTFVEVSQGLICLTLVPSQDLAIFGNLHQAGYLIGYDIQEKRVNFLQTDCTKLR
ncbi:hypothetical protein ACS0TY_022918 [Phlomoides rotata]